MKIKEMDVPVYDDPVPHVLWTDLKLALSRKEYEQLAMKTLPFDYPIMTGLTVADVEKHLTKKWK